MWDLDENGKPYLIEEFRNRPTEEQDFNSGGEPGDGLYKMSVYPFSPNNYSEKYQSMIASGLWENTIASQEVSKLDQMWCDHYGYDRYNKIVFREWLDKNGYGVEYPLAENLLAPPSDDMLFTAKAIADIVVSSSWQAIFAGTRRSLTRSSTADQRCQCPHWRTCLRTTRSAGRKPKPGRRPLTTKGLVSGWRSRPLNCIL